MIYLDSSALLKLLVEETESGPLQSWLAVQGDSGWPARVEVVSSELARVEVLRATRRLAPERLPAARSLMTGIHLLRLSAEVVALAAEVGDPLLRSLDALHLASALTIADDLDAFVAYDLRLAAATRVLGLRVVQPGVR